MVSQEDTGSALIIFRAAFFTQIFVKGRPDPSTKPSQIDRSIRGYCAFRDREYADSDSTERKAQIYPSGS